MGSDGVYAVVKCWAPSLAAGCPEISPIYSWCLEMQINEPFSIWVQVLQYKTEQQADLKKLERLNALFFSLMATGEAPKGAERWWMHVLLPVLCRPAIGRAPRQ